MGSHKPAIVPQSVIYFFFILGLLSAVAFRAILVIQQYEPSWVRPVWYAGVIGYFMFFYYRWNISRKRKKAIADYQLIEKLEQNACLLPEDREVALYLLRSIKVSMEDLNYAIIFALSVIAIGVDIVLTAIQ